MNSVKYSYKVDVRADVQETEPYLNEHGSQGWRLAGIRPGPYRHTTAFVWERPREDA